MAISSVTFRFEGLQCFADIVQTSAAQTVVNIFGYSKVITERQQTINITPYLREEITLRPIYEGHLTGSGAAVIPFITIGNTTYTADQSYCIASAERGQSLCSDLPYRIIAEGQADVISVHLDPGKSVNIKQGSSVIDYDENRATVNDIFTFSIRPTTDVTVVAADTTTIHYHTRPMGLNGKRLAWINRYGALEMWNFDYLREQAFGASSETIYTHNGYVKLNTTAEKMFVVETREATRAAIDALSYIIASPAAWLVTDNLSGSLSFEEIDVMTEECKVYSNDDLVALQVAYRPKMRVL